MTLIGFILWMIVTSIIIKLWFHLTIITTIAAAFFAVISGRLFIVAWAHKVMNEQEKVVLYTLLALVFSLITMSFLVIGIEIQAIETLTGV